MFQAKNKPFQPPTMNVCQKLHCRSRSRSKKKRPASYLSCYRCSTSVFARMRSSSTLCHPLHSCCTHRSIARLPTSAIAKFGICGCPDCIACPHRIAHRQSLSLPLFICLAKLLVRLRLLAGSGGRHVRAHVAEKVREVAVPGRRCRREGRCSCRVGVKEGGAQRGARAHALEGPACTPSQC